METIGKFFSFLRDLYIFPMEQYDFYDGERDWVMTILSGLLIYGLTAVVTVPLMIWLYRKAVWLSTRQHCQHTECGHDWTTSVSRGNEFGCKANEACCHACHLRHAAEAVVRRAHGEPPVMCPDGHGPMDKNIDGEVILDICRRCDNIVLKGSELRLLRGKWEDGAYWRGHSAGQSSGSSSGMLMGIAVGSALN